VSSSTSIRSSARADPQSPLRCRWKLYTFHSLLEFIDAVVTVFYMQDILHNFTTNPPNVAAKFSFSIHYSLCRNSSNNPTVDIFVCYSTFWLQSEFTVSMKKNETITLRGETATHTPLISKWNGKLLSTTHCGSTLFCRFTYLPRCNRWWSIKKRLPPFPSRWPMSETYYFCFIRCW
jgi:hypothetical protein